MHHSFVIALVIISFVVTSAYWDENYFDKYDPFKILTPQCEIESGVSTSCIFKKKAKKNPNPSNQYKQQQIWRHFFFGDMTVSVGKYFSQTKYERETKGKSWNKINAGCKQILVFSVRGMVLDDVVGIEGCYGYDLPKNIMYLDNALWYYPMIVPSADRRIKLDSSGEKVVLIKLKYKDVGNERKKICEKKTYNLRNQSTVAKAESRIFVDLNTTTDEDCKALKGLTGSFPVARLQENEHFFKTGDEIYGINIINEPYLRIVFWKNDLMVLPFCYLRPIVYLNKQPLTGTAIFCEESLLRDIIATKEVLQLGNKIMARSSSTEVTILLNPGNGECIKHQYKLKTAQGEDKRTYVATKTITTMHEPDQECKDFLEGKIKEQHKNEYESAINYLNKKYPGEYMPKDVKVHVRNNDVEVLYIDNNQYAGQWILMVAKGVVIDEVGAYGIPYFSVTTDTIIYNNYRNPQLIERDQNNKNLFSILSKKDDGRCSVTSYVVNNKGSKLNKQEVIKESDEKCRLLHPVDEIKVPFPLNPGETLRLLSEKNSDLAEYLS